jgi:DNA-binding winged helix-turn-helix (wHTH) protein/tetratricopeptide (TPR) repeat protein
MASGHGRPFFSFAGFRLYPTEKILERDGEIVPLTPKAVETLLVIVEGRGEVVSKERIHQRVWPDTFVAESSITRNISVIRKALGVEAIENIPKRGYRFSLPVKETEGGAARGASASPARRLGTIAAASLILVSMAVWLATRRPGTAGATEIRAATDAERDYLIGQYMKDKLAPEEIARALARFERAVRLDPSSAAAHAALADAWILAARFGVRGQREAYPQAKAGARRAVQLDPKLAGAHVALGFASLAVDWDWRKAEEEYRLAIALDPGSVLAHERLACLLSQLRRGEEALRVVRAGQQLDPVSPRVGTSVCTVLYAMRRWSEAAAECRSVLEREPGYSLAHYYLGLALAHEGRYEEAIAELRNSRVPEVVLQNDVGWLLAKSGQPEKTRQILSDVEAAVSAGTFSQPAALMLHIALGRKDDAFRDLEVEYAKRSATMLALLSEPRFDSLRDDPRFASLVSRVNLPKHTRVQAGPAH